MTFDGRELRRLMGTFCTGVTIITTCDDAGRPFGLTANAVTSLSLDPPLLLVCVDRKAESHAHFFTSKVFVVNVLSEEQEALSRRFAVSGGEKFTDVPCRPGRLGALVLDGTLAYLECRIVETHGSEALVSMLLEGDAIRRRQSALHWACVLIAAALGFGLVELIGAEDVSPGVIALLLGSTGLGDLAFYLMARRLK